MTIKTFTYGGVQMTEREFGIIAAVEARGTCPYCGRNDIGKRYGNFRRHKVACGKLFTLLGKEKIFAEWISEAKESGRHLK